MARKNPLGPDEIGPREEAEQLQQDKALAHAAAEAAAEHKRRSYYREDNMIGYALNDAKGDPLDDDNDPLLDALVRHHW